MVKDFLSFGKIAVLFGFHYPSHLYRFQDFFASVMMVVIEALQTDYPIVQVGKPNGQRIDLWKFIVKRFSDTYGVGPFHTSALKFPVGFC
jgi:hypothetical protein